MIHIGHAGELSLLFYHFASSALGTNEQDLVLIGDQSHNHFQRLVKSRDGIFKIDNMDFIASTEDVLVHFRIPVAGLVTEVRTCLKQFAHTNLHLRHNNYLVWVNPPHIPATKPTELQRTDGTLVQVLICVRRLGFYLLSLNPRS